MAPAKLTFKPSQLDFPFLYLGALGGLAVQKPLPSRFYEELPLMEPPCKNPEKLLTTPPATCFCGRVNGVNRNLHLYFCLYLSQ
jgi:hypothetical protein